MSTPASVNKETPEDFPAVCSGCGQTWCQCALTHPPTADPFAAVEMYFDRILVRQDPPKQEISGIKIAEKYADAHRQHQGEVVAIGNGRLKQGDWTLVPLQTRVGDRVAFGAHAGAVVPEDVFGPHIRVMREDEIVLRYRT